MSSDQTQLNRSSRNEADQTVNQSSNQANHRVMMHSADNAASHTGSRNADRSSSRSTSRANARTADHSADLEEIASVSRSRSAKKYSQTRTKRSRSRIIGTVFAVILAIALVAIAAAIGIYKMIIEPGLNENLQTANGSGIATDFSDDIYNGLIAPPAGDIDPFYILLIGVDNDADFDYHRSDTLILVYVDPVAKKIAMLSIPRDLYVQIPGYGKDKINAAYSLGEKEHYEFLNGTRATDNRGHALCMRTVQDLCGIEISYFAEVSFGDFIQLVDSIGGVYVDVPLPINDPDAGPSVLSAGPQLLSGEQSLTFVRSRDYLIGDYQRQANQRTFLRALAQQVLKGDPISIINSVESLTKTVYTNMSMDDIIKLALTFRGLEGSDIYTYTVPSYPDGWGGVSYIVMQENNFRGLMNSIANGEFPDAADYDLYDDSLGVVPDEYKTPGVSVSDKGGVLGYGQCQAFVVVVKNGWNIKGSAKAVSDMLVQAGYQRGEVGDASESTYQETLIVYKNESDRPAAEDIAMRLGFGKVIPSEGQYQVDGNILVIIGGDFPH